MLLTFKVVKLIICICFVRETNNIILFISHAREMLVI